MIDKCRSCHSPKLKNILALGDQYLSDFVSPKAPKPDKYPLELVICQNCTLVQLKHTTPPKKLYTDRYGYKSGINEAIRVDLKDVVKKARLYDRNDVIVDIGANDGTLLSCYDKNFPLTLVAFEPVAKLAKECEKHANYVINDYFSADLYPKKLPKAQVITSISMFYDLDDPNKFVSDVASILANDGVWIIQQNYLVGMLKQRAYDNIVHEHLEYYSLTSLEHLLNRHYLKVVDVETSDINGGSFRTYVRHMSSVEKMREQEKHIKLDKTSTYLLWGMHVNRLRKKLYKFVKELVDTGKTVYCYAASTRGSTLLQSCNLDHTLVTAAVERNKEKWGKVMASTGIPIISEEQARKDKPDYMIVLPWFFVDGFIEREKDYLKQGGKFIIPLPEFRVIGGDDI